MFILNEWYKIIIMRIRPTVNSGLPRRKAGLYHLDFRSSRCYRTGGYLMGRPSNIQASHKEGIPIVLRQWRNGFIVLLFILTACSWTGKGVLPEIKKDCSSCHVISAGKTSGQLQKPVSRLCQGCHPERSGGREHVVDTVPSMTVTRLPLQNGKITCVTCHDPHSNRYGSLLRMEAKELCRACHDK